MAKTWSGQLGAVAQNLLTLEINTVVRSSGMAAQKMPEVPVALHTLVQAYQDYLADAGFPISTGLLAAASCRVGGFAPTAAGAMADVFLRLLRAWNFSANAPVDDTEDQKKIRAELGGQAAWFADRATVADLTNGAESFEALQWAAYAAVKLPPQTANADPAVLLRIRANCRQLKEVASLLEKRYSDPQAGGGVFGTGRIPQKSQVSQTKRLCQIADPAQNSETQDMTRLFGGTLEQTTRALFAEPRPAFMIDPDVTVLVRKAWDVGTSWVCLQTSLQVDGDLVQQIAPLAPADRDFLVGLHKQAVQDAVGQWRTLFAVLKDLIGDLGQAVAGLGKF
jgi:hypothetical protein